MKSNAKCFLQGRIGRFTYLYRISVFVEDLQSDVTIGTIIVNLKEIATMANLCDERTPKYITNTAYNELKDSCLRDARRVHNFID